MTMAQLSQFAISGMYLVNNRERFPWGPRYKNGLEVPSGSGTGPTNPLTRTWYFGGNRGQNSASLNFFDDGAPKPLQLRVVKEPD